MKRVTFSVLFFIKKKKLLKNGDARIYVRITVNNLSVDHATARNVDPDYWDSGRGKSKSNDPDGKSLNHYLEHVRKSIYDAQINLEDKEIEVTAEALGQEVFGQSQMSKGLMAYYQEHNDEDKKLIDREFSRSTYKRHVTSRNLVGLYVEHRYGKSEFSIRMITADFVRGYQSFLRTERKCNHNSTVKYIRNVGKLIRRAIAEGLLDKDPFLGIRFKEDRVDVEILTKKELESLAAKDFQNDRLNQVRDVFLFCCYTGLAFIDVSQLRQKELVIRADGKLWIKKNRSKTKNEFMVPLLKIPMEILGKYEYLRGADDSKPILPVLSNQKYNSYLKEIADRQVDAAAHLLLIHQIVVGDLDRLCLWSGL